MKDINEEWGIIDRHKGDYIDAPDPTTGEPTPSTYKTKAEAVAAARELAPGDMNLIPEPFLVQKDKIPNPLESKSKPKQRDLKEFFKQRLQKLQEKWFTSGTPMSDSQVSARSGTTLSKEQFKKDYDPPLHGPAKTWQEVYWATATKMAKGGGDSSDEKKSQKKKKTK